MLIDDIYKFELKIIIEEIKNLNKAIEEGPKKIENFLGHKEIDKRIINHSKWR